MKFENIFMIFLDCAKNATFVETKDYEICQQIRKAFIANKEAQITWGMIGFVVVLCMLLLFGLLHRIHKQNVDILKKQMKAELKCEN